MKVVISAGGKGTRISSMFQDIPKPMIKIEGKPVLEHELIFLREQGFCDIIVTIGHLKDCIRDYFGNGNKWGLNITYFEEEYPLGTAGALYYLKEQLKEDFFLLNGDAIMNVDLKRMLKFHKEHHAKVTLFTHPNSHPYDSALIVADYETHQVKEWLHKEDERTIYKNQVNAGVHIIHPSVIENMKEGKCDLDREILKPLIKTGTVYAYESPEYVKDMGTPERYESVRKDFATGKVRSRNLLNSQKAIFLDRDGTLNVYKDFITSYQDIKLIDGVAEAVRLINQSEYLAIVITNQPVIARGECDLNDLEMIHNKLETELGKTGAYLDDIFFCPHHPDKGFVGERLEYKISCDCRKPAPGLLIRAAEKYHIDLSQSYMVGDSVRDIEAGLNAGCKSIYIGKENFNLEYEQYSSLLEFVRDKLQIYGKDKEV